MITTTCEVFEDKFKISSKEGTQTQFQPRPGNTREIYFTCQNLIKHLEWVVYMLFGKTYGSRTHSDLFNKKCLINIRKYKEEHRIFTLLTMILKCMYLFRQKSFRMISYSADCNWQVTYLYQRKRCIIWGDHIRLAFNKLPINMENVAI